MPPRGGNFQSLIRTRLLGLGDTVRANRFWFATAAITLLLLGASFLTGQAAAARSQVLQQERDRLEGVLARVDGWIREYRPATPQETLVWRRSEQVLAELGEEASEPASIASLLTERAEELGITDLQVGFAGQDSTAAPPEPRTLGAWTLEMQPPALEIRFTSGYREVLAFLDALPPHTEVDDLSLSRQNDGVATRFIVYTFRPKR